MQKLCILRHEQGSSFGNAVPPLGFRSASARLLRTVRDRTFRAGRGLLHVGHTETLAKTGLKARTDGRLQLIRAGEGRWGGRPLASSTHATGLARAQDPRRGKAEPLAFDTGLDVEKKRCREESAVDDRERCEQRIGALKMAIKAAVDAGDPVRAAALLNVLMLPGHETRPKRTRRSLLTEAKAKRRWRDYRTRAGARPVKDFIDALTDEEAASVVASMKEVAERGRSAARHLRGDIYEVRAQGATRSFRVLFSAEGRSKHVLLSLSAFEKRTQKTPVSELELAEARLRDWRERARAD